MNNNRFFLKSLIAIGLMGTLAGCGEPRAVMLPLEYPDGSPVRTTQGEPVMAGYQTYGTAMHANATALYESAKPPTCATCARVGAVVSEPSTLRQVTGVVGTAAVSSGTVMMGLGAMDYGQAAIDGKLGTNVSQNTSVSQKQARRDNDFEHRGNDFDHRGNDFEHRGNDFDHRGNDFDHRGNDFDHRGNDFEHRDFDHNDGFSHN